MLVYNFLDIYVLHKKALIKLNYNKIDIILSKINTNTEIYKVND